MISRRNSVEIVPFADNKACLFSGKPVSEGYKNAPDFINVYARQMLSSGSTRCRTKHTMPWNNQNLSKILLMRDCLFQLCKTTAKFRDFKWSWSRQKDKLLLKRINVKFILFFSVLFCFFFLTNKDSEDELSSTGNFFYHWLFYSNTKCDKIKIKYFLFCWSCSLTPTKDLKNKIVWILPSSE